MLFMFKLPVLQLVTSPMPHPGVVSSILACSHTFMEIIYGHSPPFDDSRSAVVTYKRKYVH